MPKYAQEASEHIRRFGKLFAMDTVMVFVANSRRQAELKTILRDGGAHVVNWSYQDLSLKPEKELMKVNTVYTDMTALKNRQFKAFLAKRISLGSPVKLLSYIFISKLVIDLAVGLKRKVLEDFFATSNVSFMAKLHPQHFSVDTDEVIIALISVNHASKKELALCFRFGNFHSQPKNDPHLGS